MKLIIDIPEEAKRHIDTFKGKFLCGNGCDIIQAIQNGTPLDDVKAEIMSKHFSIVEKNDFDNGRTYGHDECLSILDNIGKAESEDRE